MADHLNLKTYVICVSLYLSDEKKNLLMSVWYFFIPVLGDLLSWTAVVEESTCTKNLSVCREMIGKDEC